MKLTRRLLYRSLDLGCPAVFLGFLARPCTDYIPGFHWGWTDYWSFNMSGYETHEQIGCCMADAVDL